MPINAVIPGLFISGYKDVTEKNLKLFGIKHVISIMMSKLPFHQRFSNVKYYYFFMIDKEKTSLNKDNSLQKIVEILETVLQKKESVLVHCRVGKSRSAAAICAFLMRRNRQTFDAVFHHVRKCRPIVDPNPSFVAQLREFERRSWRFRTPNKHSSLKGTIYNKALTRLPIQFHDRKLRIHEDFEWVTDLEITLEKPFLNYYAFKEYLERTVTVNSDVTLMMADQNSSETFDKEILFLLRTPTKYSISIKMLKFYIDVCGLTVTLSFIRNVSQSRYSSIRIHQVSQDDFNPHYLHGRYRTLCEMILDLIDTARGVIIFPNPQTEGVFAEINTFGNIQTFVQI